MSFMSQSLISYGFNNWLLESIEPDRLAQHEIARVTAVHKDSYTITNGEAEVGAELVGKLLFNATSPTDFPGVGDWVLANFYDENTFSIIHEILPRKTLLKRKTPGKKIDFQLIAANIDIAFIVQSLNENFNIRRLERYLVMCSESNIKPAVLLSKSDLIPLEDIENKINQIQKLMAYTEVVHFSNETEDGLQHVERLLSPGLTYCLLGSSGVGKTTLLNKLIGEAIYGTKSVSKKESKGRHATTHRQLVKLPGGAMIVDTPGMRELGNFSIELGLDETFSEIIALSEQCYFNNCTHVSEKGCAILEAIENGQLSAKRFQSYTKMAREARYNEMSYLDKRNKDKEFGKLCKNVMKHHKKKR